LTRMGDPLAERKLVQCKMRFFPLSHYRKQHPSACTNEIAPPGVSPEPEALVRTLMKMKPVERPVE